MGIVHVPAFRDQGLGLPGPSPPETLRFSHLTLEQRVITRVNHGLPLMELCSPEG